MLSATVLTLEVLLTRVVSVLYYPVGVYFVISLALLGTAAGGVFVALTARHLERRMALILPLACLGLALGALLASIVTVNASTEPRYLVLLALVIALPFLGGGVAVSLLFNASPAMAHRLYLADLSGAGLGAILASVVLLETSAQHAVILTVCSAGLAAVLLGTRWKFWQQLLASVVVVLMIVVSPLLSARLSIPALPPKELGTLLSARDDVVVEYQAWSPVARVDVVSLPGDRIELPDALDYKLVTQDGGAPSMILGAKASDPEADFAEHTILSIPYWIKARPEVLIIGLGGGPDVVTALRCGARRVVGVEINSRMIEIVTDRFASFAVIVMLLFLLSTHAWLLDDIVRGALGWPLVFRILLALLVVGTAGVLMGVPFPTGISMLAGKTEGMIAWAWGMNGIASVIAPLVNLTISVTFGLRVALLSAAALYLLGLLVIRSWAGCTTLERTR